MVIKALLGAGLAAYSLVDVEARPLRAGRQLQFTDAPWGYTSGEIGNVLTPPWAWGNRQDNNCAGRGQSPISIEYKEAGASAQSIDANVVTGTAVEMELVRKVASGASSNYAQLVPATGVANFGTFTVPGDTEGLYEAIRIDIHEPAEHVFNLDPAVAPVQQAAEVQVVFQRIKDASSSEYVIMSRLYQNMSTSVNNDFDKLGFGATIGPVSRGAKDYIGDLAFATTTVNYVHYYGSLTTPPCTESVKWVIDTNIREVRPQQLAAIRLEYGGPTSRAIADPFDVNRKEGTAVPPFQTRDHNGRPVVENALMIEGSSVGLVVAVILVSLLVPPVLLIGFFKMMFGS